MSAILFTTKACAQLNIMGAIKVFRRRNLPSKTFALLSNFYAHIDEQLGVPENLRIESPIFTGKIYTGRHKGLSL